MRTVYPHSLRTFVDILRRHGELVEISAPVDPSLELPEIHRRVVQNNGPALLFSNVVGSQFPVATNLFSSPRKCQLAFGTDVEQRIERVINFLTRHSSTSLSSLWNERRTLASLVRLGTKERSSASVLEQTIHPVDINCIPFTKSWPDDGGHFLTLPLVYTESPSGKGGNLGMYRIQRFDSTTAGLHWQVGKGGGYHFKESESLGINLPVTIFLGGPPALIISSIAPLPENVSELLLASFLLDRKVDLCRLPSMPLPLLSECDVALVGYAPPHERHLEGPFGDHYGYQSPALPFPLFRCTSIHHRRDAIIPATVVGRPLQEDAFIGQFVHQLLRPFFSLLIPSVRNLHVFPETGFHPLAAACVHERYEKESLTTALRLLGEGQLALTKILMVTDQDVPLNDISSLLSTILERIRPEEDLLILSYTSLDTLDMTGPKPNRGSKAILFGNGEKKRSLPVTLSQPPPRNIQNAVCFTPGCLVIDGPTFQEMADPQALLECEAFAQWPLLLLVDKARQCCSSSGEFLWNAFTRFEPGRDIYAKRKDIRRNGVSFSFPLLIDARMKPSYSQPLVADSKTLDLVDRRWDEYFSSCPSQ